MLRIIADGGSGQRAVKRLLLLLLFLQCHFSCVGDTTYPGSEGMVELG